MSAVRALFRKHLLATNIVTSGVLLGTGDFVVQRMNIVYERRKSGVTIQYDYYRTGRMTLMGLALGPINHYWYAFLDRVLVGTSHKTVLKKIICDQTAAPLFNTGFLFGMNLLEGRGLAGGRQEWKEKFITIFLIDWCFWPPLQLINFKFVPGRYRVLYVSFVTLLWNTFLSYMKHVYKTYETNTTSLGHLDISE